MCCIVKIYRTPLEPNKMYYLNSKKLESLTTFIKGNRAEDVR